MESTDYGFIPLDVEGVQELADLALDLSNSWDHGADEVWGMIDPEIWALTRNPWLCLQTVSRLKLKELFAQPKFRRMIDDHVARHERRAQKLPWFKRAHSGSQITAVAYFSMEFGVSEALPIYSGGLGNVAGDQLKAADDLGVPVVAVGLLYQRGYFRQAIDDHGNQIELFPYNDPAQLPIMPLRDSDGQWHRIEINLPGHKLWLRVWQARIGRLRLLLIDSNDPANSPAYRGVTSELYGGDSTLRLDQELVLGIGGWRLLRGLGITTEVCHLNEGHAAFAVLERARSFMEDNGCDFATALAVTRAGNLFTTHTPVAAGFDRFSPELITSHMKQYAEKILGIGIDDLLALGRAPRAGKHEPFNMAYLAMRGCGAANAVSRLHGEVSRELFQPLFERWPAAEVPIGAVTNGVHTPTWHSPAADQFWTQACGDDPWEDVTEDFAAQIRVVPDSAIWELRAENRSHLIEYVRDRHNLERSAATNDNAEVQAFTDLTDILDPNALTLGFARRFATYKRPNLLLHDPERLARILANPQHPVQLIVAGKAHPADMAGKVMVREWIEFTCRPELHGRVIFLSDYDLMLAEELVRGVDLWINTPRRPWEACGTSGMKVLVNGGLNLSELDGWWAEAYAPGCGWALGDRAYHNDDPAWDAFEAGQLYTILEQEVIPLFYARDRAGVPAGWVAAIRESMARLTPQFSANRAVREYTDKYYLPAAAAYRKRAQNKGALGAQLVEWSKQVRRHWPAVHFGNVEVETADGNHKFISQVYLDDLDPAAVLVELYADSKEKDAPPFRCALTRGAPLVGARGWTYSAEVPAGRPASDYTLRLVPYHPDAAVPLEESAIKWQR